MQFLRLLTPYNSVICLDQWNLTCPKMVALSTPQPQFVVTHPSSTSVLRWQWRPTPFPQVSLILYLQGLLFILFLWFWTSQIATFASKALLAGPNMSWPTPSKRSTGFFLIPLPLFTHRTSFWRALKSYKVCKQWNCSPLYQSQRKLSGNLTATSKYFEEFISQKMINI